MITPETTDAIVDGNYKDSSPLDTVARIQKILEDFGVEPQMTWFDSGVPYCYSNKLTLPGTTFRTIGKGLTKEFAIASAYGEMIERLQIGFIYGPTSLKDGDYAIDDAKYEMRPAKELLEANRLWYQRMADVLEDSIGEKMTAEQVLTQCATRDGMVSVTPYYDLTTGQKVYFPIVLRKRIYGSNGCAAGNTPEEALVQAISEIVERSHQIRSVKEGLSLPEIPDGALKKYKISYEIIKFARESGYKVIMKDASLGTGFPVVCACLIERRTGRYHTHFGAHPVFEIALERSLTESFQGRNIASMAENEDFSRKSNVKFSLNAFYTELRRSTGNKLPGFFVDESPLTFDPDMGVHTCDNKEILRYCIDFFAKQGFPLLVRDCSCLGFPTYQIIVPGYSECYINRIATKTDDQRYAPYAITALRNPSKASVPDMMGLMMHLDRVKQLDSGFKDVHSFTMHIKAPSNAPHKLQNFLMSASLGYFYYKMGKYADAAVSVGKMIPKAEEKDLEFLICLKRYLLILADGYGAEYGMKVISYFHNEDIVAKMQDILSRKANPFDEFTLHCDRKCEESCPFQPYCYLNRVDEIAAILDQRMSQLDFEDMANYLKNIL
ncbi:MAG: YcaO-like family protein [Oscillospiraceae bacterium]|nr:YcaO-like family protein [Oscillospiraceae bacterium]